MIKIYTDGSCIGNPGAGGWASLIRTESEEIKLQGGELHSTNNRMEMQAVIEALAWVIENQAMGPVEIYSDSSLIINTMNQGWKRKKNRDLWATLDEQLDQLEGRRVSWHWVKGHAGHPENEDCDQRAQEQAQMEEENRALLEPDDPRLSAIPGEAPSLF